MTPDTAVRFLARWRLVNDAEIAELRATPIETKLRQLSALMASVTALGWHDALDADTDAVRERWRRLRIHADTKGA